MVQPQDSVTLNGIESKDDKGIESFQWKLMTPYPYAVIEVGTLHLNSCVSLYYWP